MIGKDLTSFFEDVFTFHLQLQQVRYYVYPDLDAVCLVQFVFANYAGASNIFISVDEETDEICLATDQFDITGFKPCQTPKLWESVIGAYIRFCWELINNRGYSDCLQIDFYKETGEQINNRGYSDCLQVDFPGEQTFRIQFEAKASSLDTFIVRDR